MIKFGERGDPAHRVGLCNSHFCADDQLLVSQHAYGIPDACAPVLHLRPADSGDRVTSYLESFERIWAGAVSLE